MTKKTNDAMAQDGWSSKAKGLDRMIIAEGFSAKGAFLDRATAATQKDPSAKPAIEQKPTTQPKKNG